MMVRLSVSKREKGRRKRANVMSSQLHSLTHFSDISALTGGTPHPEEVRVVGSNLAFMQMYVGLMTLRSLGRGTDTWKCSAIPSLLHLSPGSESY